MWLSATRTAALNRANDLPRAKKPHFAPTIIQCSAPANLSCLPVLHAPCSAEHAVRRAMAATAGAKFFQHVRPGRVRLWVTLPACDDLGMLGMTPGTSKTRVFRGNLVQFIVRVLVTPSTGFLAYVLRISHLADFMRGMAGQTLRLGQPFLVRTMALQALRNISVLRMMARLAMEFRMLRYVCLHLLVRFGMADVTTFLQGTHRRNFHGRVGICVTFGAKCQILSMDLLVACRTFWKDICIFHLSGMMNVKAHVAGLAIEPVFATLILYEVKKLQVTLPTVFRCQVIDVLGVLGRHLHPGGSLLGTWCFCGHCASQKDCHKS